MAFGQGHSLGQARSATSKFVITSIQTQREVTFQVALAGLMLGRGGEPAGLTVVNPSILQQDLPRKWRQNATARTRDAHAVEGKYAREPALDFTVMGRPRNLPFVPLHPTGPL